jgi:hypothetical protein
MEELRTRRQDRSMGCSEKDRALRRSALDSSAPAASGAGHQQCVEHEKVTRLLGAQPSTGERQDHTRGRFRASQFQVGLRQIAPARQVQRGEVGWWGGDPRYGGGEHRAAGRLGARCGRRGGEGQRQKVSPHLASLPPLRFCCPSRVALGSGQAHLRVGERVRGHLYLPWAAAVVA